MTYFDQIDPINDIFDQLYAHKPDWNNFSKFLEENFFGQFPKILTCDVILAPKMAQFWPFSPKISYFDQIDTIIEIFDHIYVHKPDWNNFSKFLEENFFGKFPKILTCDVILAPKMAQLWPFSPKNLFLGNKV